jgi:hypothetical protein
MRILAVGLLLLLASARWAVAQPVRPILLWGFQRGCQPLSDVTRDVQQHLETTVTRPVDVLSPDSRLLGCEGVDCARLVLRACPAGKPRILGGKVEQNAARSVTRLRLWLHDAETGETAYHDNYCQGCDLTSMLKVNAAEIAQYPSFTLPPGNIPTYCQPAPIMQELPARSGKIFWVVYGKEQPGNKAAITAVVRQQLQKSGPQIPFQHDGREYTLGILKRIVAREPGAQVLTVEAQGNGVVELFLYDDATELTEIERVECAACDRDSLFEQVKQATLNLLSHCFGESCARAGRSRAPAEACQPLVATRCGDEALPLLLGGPSASAAASQERPVASAGIAKLTKGAVWSLFAASATTTAILIAADFTAASRVQSSSGASVNLLLPAIGATSALTILSLGIAIPTTIIVNRAAPPGQQRGASSRHSPGPAAQALGIQCPN